MAERSSFALVSGPVNPLLTTAEAKEHLRVDFSDDDGLIDAYVEAATDLVDAEWGELGRALVTQTWAMTVSDFPTIDPIKISLPPVQSISSIKYFDQDNVEQTFAASNYRVFVNSEETIISLAEGKSWPAIYNRPDAVTVEFVTGYGDAASDVPAGIRNAVKLMVGHWYENRSATTGQSLDEMPFGVRSLLHKYRVVRGHI